MSTVESIARPRRNGERRRAPTASISKESPRSEERFSRNAETDLVCRLLLEKKKKKELFTFYIKQKPVYSRPLITINPHGVNQIYLKNSIITCTVDHALY